MTYTCDRCGALKKVMSMGGMEISEEMVRQLEKCR